MTQSLVRTYPQQLAESWENAACGLDLAMDDILDTLSVEYLAENREAVVYARIRSVINEARQALNDHERRIEGIKRKMEGAAYDPTTLAHTDHPFPVEGDARVV